MPGKELRSLLMPQKLPEAEARKVADEWRWLVLFVGFAEHLIMTLVLRCIYQV